MIRFETYEMKNDAPCVKAWRNKQGKPFAHIQFQSIERRAEWMASQTASDERDAIAKIERKATKQADTLAMRAAVKVGSIFVDSWGYDQTNVNAYQVVSVSKSGATVTVREIVCAQIAGTDNGGMSARVRPVADSFAEGSEPMSKTINQYGVKIRRSSATLHTEGDDYYSSWYA